MGFKESKIWIMSKLTKWQREFLHRLDKLSSDELLDMLGEAYEACGYVSKQDFWKFRAVVNELKRRIDDLTRMLRKGIP